jgi:Putative Flp pilus-assembly TadE/G-like
MTTRRTDPTADRRTRRGHDADRGSVTVFFAVAVIGILVLLGLVVDGGAKVRAVQRADTLAAEAARAGGQAITLPPTIAGQRPRADPRAAASAARAYLAANGVTGTVTVTPDGRRLEVTVTTSTPTVFLGLIGVTTVTAHGHASADLTFGITGVAQP